MNPIFKFKQFNVAQDKCAMKIGTDGVLLGAWAHINHNPSNILDIGSGTGVIALMLAQRTAETTFGLEIDGLEIHPDAHQQCVDNFENSKWNNRLFCYHASLQEFSVEIESTYDLIVSNPPYFKSTARKNMDEARQAARFSNTLPLHDLIIGVNKLLSESGIFTTIFPFERKQELLDLAKENRLYPKRICHVKGHSTAKTTRVLVEFTRSEKEPEITELVIELKRHDYTEAYKKLVEDFYLKM